MASLDACARQDEYPEFCCMEWSWWLILAVALIVLAAFFVRVVPVGQTYSIARFGTFHRTLDPGVHVVVPLVDRTTHRVNMLGRAREVRFHSLRTADDHRLQADCKIYFQVLDARKVIRQSADLDKAVEQLLQRVLIDLTAEMDQETLFSRSPHELDSWLLGLLNQEAQNWGVRMTRVNARLTEENDKN